MVQNNISICTLEVSHLHSLLNSCRQFVNEIDLDFMLLYRYLRYSVTGGWGSIRKNEEDQESGGEWKRWEELWGGEVIG